jgi:hypothetical protein
MTELERGRLAGVVELELGGRGPKRAFVFDPHRLALSAWAQLPRPSLLVTLDRHYDTVAPRARAVPGLDVATLDAFARNELDVRNYDHVLAAMEADVLSHAVVIARAKPVGAVTGAFTDSRGGRHELIGVPTVDRLAEDFGTPKASPEGRHVAALLAEAQTVILDVDLDCFTTPSDADPTTVVPWTEELIREFLKPRGSEAFWAAVLQRCVGLTLAREPSHCGGLIAAGRLFEALAKVLFVELLEGDLP